MEITQFAYIPLMVIVDGETKHINYAGLNHIGWSKGLTGNWSIPKLAKITVTVPDTKECIELILTMTDKMLSLMSFNGDLTDSDARYIAGIVMLMLDGDLSIYQSKLRNGFPYTISRSVRILSKITETGVTYVAVN